MSHSSSGSASLSPGEEIEVRSHYWCLAPCCFSRSLRNMKGKGVAFTFNFLIIQLYGWKLQKYSVIGTALTLLKEGRQGDRLSFIFCFSLGLISSCMLQSVDVMGNWGSSHIDYFVVVTCFHVGIIMILALILTVVFNVTLQQPETVSVQSSVLGKGVKHRPPPIKLPSSSGNSSSGIILDYIT